MIVVAPNWGTELLISSRKGWTHPAAHHGSNWVNIMESTGLKQIQLWHYYPLQSSSSLTTLIAYHHDFYNHCQCLSIHAHGSLMWGFSNAKQADEVPLPNDVDSCKQLHFFCWKSGLHRTSGIQTVKPCPCATPSWTETMRSQPCPSLPSQITWPHCNYNNCTPSWPFQKQPTIRKNITRLVQTTDSTHQKKKEKKNILKCIFG